MPIATHSLSSTRRGQGHVDSRYITGPLLQVSSPQAMLHTVQTAVHEDLKRVFWNR
jgi:hypothetical protein